MKHTLVIKRRPDDTSQGPAIQLWNADLDGEHFATIVNSKEHGYEVIWADRSDHYAAKSLEDAEAEIWRKAGVPGDPPSGGRSSVRWSKNTEESVLLAKP